MFFYQYGEYKKKLADKSNLGFVLDCIGILGGFSMSIGNFFVFIFFWINCLPTEYRYCTGVSWVMEMLWTGKIQIQKKSEKKKQNYNERKNQREGPVRS